MPDDPNVRTGVQPGPPYGLADIGPGWGYGFVVPRQRRVGGTAGKRSTGDVLRQAVLPDLESDAQLTNLPVDPNDMLTDDERSQLVSDLIKMASQRREAETASGSLRLA